MDSVFHTCPSWDMVISWNNICMLDIPSCLVRIHTGILSGGNPKRDRRNDDFYHLHLRLQRIIHYCPQSFETKLDKRGSIMKYPMNLIKCVNWVTLTVEIAAGATLPWDVDRTRTSGMTQCSMTLDATFVARASRAGVLLPRLWIIVHTPRRCHAP